jgi:hypothetical protein
MTSQQEADFALAQWQALRALAPEERIDRLMTEFFQPPIELDVRYQDQINAVMSEMAQ